MPDRLWFTNEEEACELLARDPLALLVGFALDQQVPVQKAFSSPLELKRAMVTGKDGMAGFVLKLWELYDPLWRSAPVRALRVSTRGVRRRARAAAARRGG